MRGFRGATETWLAVDILVCISVHGLLHFLRLIEGVPGRCVAVSVLVVRVDVPLPFVGGQLLAALFGLRNIFVWEITSRLGRPEKRDDYLLTMTLDGFVGATGARRVSHVGSVGVVVLI